MLPSAESADPPQAVRRTDYRVVAAVLLLAVAAVFTWLTIDLLSSRRTLRTELAEISHVRYGLMNIDRWAEKLVPILERKVDGLELSAADRASLRPAVENALYRLLDEVKQKAGSAPGGQGNAFMANMMIGALKPHVPEYADVVLAELTRPETKDAARKYIKRMLADTARTISGNVDTRWYQYILKSHGCGDAAECQKQLGATIAGLEEKVVYYYLTVLAASALAFVLLLTGRPILRRSGTVVLLLFCVVLLVGGVLTPMVEVEAKISHLEITFLGERLAFSDQLLYFQSKSVLEVFRTLISIGKPDMWIVGVLVLMFSVIFPVAKIITLTYCLYRPATLRKNRLARFLGLESSKWSMADVMALAIFMAFVAFNGIVTNSMRGMQQTLAQVSIPTEGSKVLPGYFLFIGFCLASLFLSKKLERGIEATSAEPQGEGKA